MFRLILFLLLSGSVGAVNLQFGEEFQVTKVSYRKYSGRNILPNKFAKGYNAYFDVLWEHFGVEVGYDFFKVKDNEINLNVGDTYFDITMNEPGYKVMAQHKELGPYAGALFRYKVLFAVIGVSNLRVSSEYTFIANATGDMGQDVRSFRQTKIVPVVKAGFIYNFNKMVGCRVVAGYRGMSRFEIASNEREYLKAKLDDRYSLGIGFHMNLV